MEPTIQLGAGRKEGSNSQQYFLYVDNIAKGDNIACLSTILQRETILGPYTAKRRDLLRNPSPRPERLPEVLFLASPCNM